MAIVDRRRRGRGGGGGFSGSKLATISNQAKTGEHFNKPYRVSEAHLKFVTFFSVRWTTLGPAAVRIIELWEHLESSGSVVATKPIAKQTKSELKIMSMLQSKT